MLIPTYEYIFRIVEYNSQIFGKELQMALSALLPFSSRPNKWQGLRGYRLDQLSEILGIKIS